MKKFYKKLWLLALLAVMPIANVVAQNVAKIGDMGYATLAEAVAAVTTDGTQTTITMIADETIVGNAGITIAKGKNVVLDLNGKNVIGNTDSGSTYALITNNGTLTIQDATGTGKLEVYPTNPWVYSEADPSGYASNLIRNDGTLTVENGNLYNDGKGSACYAIDNYTYNGGYVTINGGKVDAAKSSAVRLFYNNGGSVTVNGGVIGHYNSDTDRSYMGIQVQNGTNANVTVNGGTVDGYYALYTGNSGGSTVITGGTFDGYVGFGENTPNISISGGEFNSWVGTWGTQTGFISGGTFAVDPDEELLADGLVPANNGNGGYSVISPVVKIGDTQYATLEAAIAAAEDGQTVTLLANCTGNGISVPQGKFTTGLTVDFGGFTYTVDGELAGSPGTKTQAFQLLKDNKITFMNGTIYSEKAKMLVQNYSNLTLNNMVLTLNNTSYNGAYTLSNNNGDVVIDGSTINANPTTGSFAFDVCRYSSYPSVNVEVKGSSVINGNVEISASGSDAKDGFGLTLTSGTMTGDIVVDATAKAAMEATPAKATVTKDDDFTQAAPEGFKWESNGDGTSKLVVDEIVFTDGTDTYTISEDTTTPKVTYKRTFDTSAVGVFKPWFVPFDYTITAEDVKNFDFHSINKVEFAEGSTTKMQMRLSTAMQAGSELTANTPYVYVPKKAGTFEFTTENVTLKAESPETSRATYNVTGAVQVDFYGVYTIAAPATEGDYIYYMTKTGTISRGTKPSSTVKAFRWIFRITENGQTGSAAYTFGFADDDDDLTAVSNATVAAEGEVVGYYTLSGQKVSEPTKGVYVVKYANGTSKKVVF